MKKILILGLSLILLSCTAPAVEQRVCLDGKGVINFTIDTTGHPGTYRDDRGVWHIKHAGLNYFTIKGTTAQLDPHYVINGVPLVETGFDSNFFYTAGNVIWTYPVYSFLGLYSSSQMNTPIPYGTATYTFPELVKRTTVMNLAGYEIQHNRNVDVNTPAYSRYFATYSKYTYTPQQSMVFFKDFEGKSASIYISVTYGENKLTVSQEIKVSFEH